MSDFLDDVLEMETQFARDGAAAGERDAMLKAQAGGLVLGLQKGAEIGTEMGFYDGVSVALEMFQECGRELPSRVAQTHIKLASQVAEFAPHIGDAMFEDLLPAVQTCRARHKMLTSHLGAHKALQPFPQLESTSTPPVSGVDPSLIQAAKAGSLTF